MNFYEFSTDDKKDIVSAYKDGQSSKSIADQWDLSPSVVFRILRKAGVSIRPRGRVGKSPVKLKPKPSGKTKTERALAKRIATANAKKKAKARKPKPKAKKAAPRPKAKK